MARHLDAPNCGQITAHFTSHFPSESLPWSTRMQFHYDGTWNNPEVVVLVNDIVLDIDNQLMPRMSTHTNIDRVTAIDLADPLHAEVIQLDGTAGSIDNFVMPLNVTLSTLQETASRIRGGRAHNFLTGFTENSLSSSDLRMWSATDVSDVGTFWTHILGSLTNTFPTLGGLQWGVVHYSRHKVILDPPQFERFTGFIVDTKVHGRTRRLGRV